jgi:hypothetical protein
VASSCECGYEPEVSKKGGEFPDQLSDCHLCIGPITVFRKYPMCRFPFIRILEIFRSHVSVLSRVHHDSALESPLFSTLINGKCAKLQCFNFLLLPKDYKIFVLQNHLKTGSTTT